MWIMIYGIQNTMIRHEFMLVLLALVPLISAIRVDWNTNKGPILPPTSTERPIPKQPYREPAAVWENQDDDILNPNPYRYILPPTSRPRLQDDNYARAPISPKEESQMKQPIYGKLLTKFSDSDYKTIKKVPTLAVQYIPNIGFKYNAVVPSSSKVYSSSKGSDVYYDKYSKLNGKFNPKSKKYKVYEKVKYVPQIFILSQYQQALPYLPTPQPFTNQPVTTLQTTPETYYQNDSKTSKHWSQKMMYYQHNNFAQNSKSQR